MTPPSGCECGKQSRQFSTALVANKLSRRQAGKLPQIASASSTEVRLVGAKKSSFECIFHLHAEATLVFS
jgi:hypothetical protein